MAGRCTVCGHPRLLAIESKLRDGMSKNAAARAFGLSRYAIRRHITHAQARMLAAETSESTWAADAAVEANGSDSDPLLAKIRSIQHEIDAVQEECARRKE